MLTGGFIPPAALEFFFDAGAQDLALPKECVMMCENRPEGANHGDAGP